MGQVLKFPAQEELLSGSDRSDQKDWVQLRIAAIALDAAMQRQIREVAAYRDTIKDLDDAIKRLGSSLDKYETKLARIDVEPIRRHALRLAQIMGG